MATSVDFPYPILQVIGKKKSGKTTTVIDFITVLKEIKKEVAVFKHTHHTVSMDVPQTDTYRFAEAGANQVGMQNAKGFFWHETRPIDNQVSLTTEITNYVTEKTDFVLVEGFKGAVFPKLLLLRLEDNIEDFKDFTPIFYVATLYPEKVSDTILDFSTREKRKAWFLHYVQEVKK